MTGISPSNPPQSPVHEAAEAATNTAPVEVDTRPVLFESVTYRSRSTYTASLTSSVLNYPTEFGRQYHAYNADSYNFPNDEAERERLDLTHLLITKGIGNRLFLAPVDLNRSARVLDIGTGTEIGAICVGEEYPSAEIIGNDLSAIQPTWHLHPGGWAEFQDFDLLYYSEDGSITDDHHLLKWMKLFIDTARTKLNREPCPGPRLEGWIRHAGFTNVVHRKFRLPLGSWPKEPQLKDIGMCNIAQLLEGLEAFSLKIFCGVLGMPMDEVLVMLAQIRQELYARKYHALFNFRFELKCGVMF
uniref:Secondary metabolism regulator LAE1 n=1 Tax=Fusarium oxysporum (strain Fo5176) TaxID=660025 RepID=A0A0D2YJK3_FUSOF